MSLVRRLARPLLAAPFVDAGLDAARHPGPLVEPARPLLARAGGQLHLPSDPTTAVRATGGMTAGAGLLFATGRFPRLSAVLMAAGMAPLTYAGHAFWQEKDPEQRRAQRVAFVRDAGLIGAALVAAVDTDGKPGLAWRGRHASSAARKQAKRAAKDAKRAARSARREARARARTALPH